MPYFAPLIIKPSVAQLANYPHLPKLAWQLSQYYHAHHVTEADLKTIGLALWQVLDIDATLAPQALLIECANNAIESLPWECLYHPQLGFLGKHADYTLSRRVSSDNKTVQLSKGPFNILLVTAQAKTISHHGRLDVEIEQQTVRSALAPFIKAGWVHFYAPDDGRFATFVELLHSQPWHLVILSGHGVFKEKGENAGAFFVFESEQGSGELITAGTLAQAFKGTNVQCVVVAACQSAQFIATPDFQGSAPDLQGLPNLEGLESHTSLITPIMQAGVPHVVGMREPLIDRAASVFVRTLCVALAQQAPVDVAVQQGRCAMTQLLAPNEVWRDAAFGCSHSDASVGQWCLPMLLSYDPSQPLLDWDFCPQPLPPNPVGCQIALPDIFIGRRQELRTLGAALRTGTRRRLLIRGAGGLGKTALAGQLAMTLAEQGYRVLAYQAGGEMAFIPMLAQALELPEMTDLEVLLKKLRQSRWLLWLDNLESIQNPRSGALTDESIQTTVDILYRWEAADLRILLTSRWAMPAAMHCYDYRLSHPEFSDFSRYIQYLGLPYPFLQQLKIYQRLGGNFQGVQLLQNMPLCVDATGLSKQLAIVHRYLRAYLRDN